MCIMQITCFGIIGVEALQEDTMGFTHLFFTDDLILFSKVRSEASDAISVVLEIFCKESGQKITVEKSWIYFSLNVNANLRLKVCDKLGIHEATNIGKYLGFPIRHKGASRNQYIFIAERVMSKFAGWKAKFLSFAGRVVLVKSVMFVALNYIM